MHRARPVVLGGTSLLRALGCAAILCACRRGPYETSRTTPISDDYDEAQQSGGVGSAEPPSLPAPGASASATEPRGPSPPAPDATILALTVSTEPPHLHLLVDGEEAGPAPVVLSSVRPREHTVEVRDDCWRSEPRKVLVRAAQGEQVLAATRRFARIELSAHAYAGGAATGVAWLDGQELGAVPGRYDVPVCAARLEVRTAVGDSGLVPLALREGATAHLDVVVAPAPREGMVFVGGGEFRMGREGVAAPVTLVRLDPYDFDQREVSVDAYAACVRAGRCSVAGVESCGAEGNWGRAGHGTHPMNCVDWEQARTFCEWRAARLPTEAEWELAARGFDDRAYPWGHAHPDPAKAHAAYVDFGHLVPGGRVRRSGGADTLGDGTVAVDACAEGASPFGALNMSGNVWEWVHDWYAPLPGGEVVRPRGPSEGSARVVRGGGWDSMFAAGLRTFDREKSRPTGRGRNLGFRCAADPSR